MQSISKKIQIPCFFSAAAAAAAAAAASSLCLAA